MKTTIKPALVLLAATVLAILALPGCADRADPLDSGLGFHPADWAQEGSPENHAAVLEEAGLPDAVTSCSTCHGMDFGKGAETDCYACHAIAADEGHPLPGVFLNSTAPEFHGKVVRDLGGTDPCADCHAWTVDGELDFSIGGWSQQNCSQCHAGGRSGHPGPGVWFNLADPGSHMVKAGGAGFVDCADCHGADYLGGWTGVGCDLCHAPPDGVSIHVAEWVQVGSPEGSHGFLFENGLVTQQSCAGCHGADLEGGWTEQDCRPCHVDFYE